MDLHEFEPNLVYIASSSLPNLHKETLYENQDQNKKLKIACAIKNTKEEGRKEEKEGWGLQWHAHTTFPAVGSLR